MDFYQKMELKTIFRHAFATILMILTVGGGKVVFCLIRAD